MKTPSMTMLQILPVLTRRALIALPVPNGTLSLLVRHGI